MHIISSLYPVSLISISTSTTSFSFLSLKGQLHSGMWNSLKKECKGKNWFFKKRALHLDLDPKISVSQEAQVLSCLLDCPNSDSDPRMHPNTGLYHHLNLAATKLFMSRDRILFADLELRIWNTFLTLMVGWRWHGVAEAAVTGMRRWKFINAPWNRVEGTRITEDWVVFHGWYAALVERDGEESILVGTLTLCTHSTHSQLWDTCALFFIIQENWTRRGAFREGVRAAVSCIFLG